MQLPDEGDRPLSINLVPMIDVIFSILAFFILSTLFLVPSEGLDVDLPEALTSDSQTQTALRLSINSSGQMRLQGEDVTVGNVKEVLENIRESEQTQVVIEADSQVSHGQVVAVMDQLRQIPNLQLAIATVPPEQ